MLFVCYFFFCMLLFHLIGQKSFFQKGDGVQQQYMYFLYTRRWVRTVLVNFFISRRFDIPMWDMSEFGHDIFISGIPLGDPFNWIAVICPIGITELVFDIMVILRMYFTGVAFLAYCHYRKTSSWGAILGALAYVFSGIVKVGVLQTSFLTVYLLFPLLILGVDRLLNENKPVFFTLILAICTFYSFYFTYMMGIIVFVYCVIWVLFLKDRSLKFIGKKFFIVLGYSVIGILMGIGPVLPSLVNMTGLTRFETQRSIPFFYDLTLYRDMILGAFSYRMLNTDDLGGFSAVIVPALYCLFRNFRKHRKAAVLFILFSISFVFPFFGSLFNGMNYPTHRYIFGYAFLLSFILADTIEEFRNIGKKEYGLFVLLSFLLGAVSIICNDYMGVLSSISILVGILFISLGKQKERRKQKLYINVAVLSTCIILEAGFFLSCGMIVCVDFGKANKEYLNSEGKDFLTALGDTDRFRYDKMPLYTEESQRNSSMILGLNGYDYYFSNSNPYVTGYLNELGVIADYSPLVYGGLRGRNYLEILNGTKYITENSALNIFPFSYSPLGRDDVSDWMILSADNEVSMVYGYDHAIGYDEFHDLSAEEKEEIMMSAVVLENGDTSVSDYEIKLTDVPYDVIGSYGITREGNELVVGEDAYVKLAFEELRDVQIIFQVDGLLFDRSSYSPSNRYQLTAVLTGNGVPVKEDAFLNGTPTSHSYVEMYTWVFDFGYCEEQIDGVTVYFDTPGRYTLDDITIMVRTQDDISSTVSSFFSQAETDKVSYELSDNSMMISTCFDAPKYLYVAVPYSEGWSASVDGQEVEILRANEAFMAIPVNGGSHDVEMRYRTPFLREGLILSGISAAVFISVIVVRKSRTSKRDISS